MSVLESRLDPASAECEENRAHMDGLVTELRERLVEARKGGGDAAVRRHREQGKLMVRDRLEKLLDPGTPFLEIGALAGFGMHEGQAPAAGIVCGVGRVRGREVMVVANDATVKGGTYFPITVKKHLRAQEMALENRLPSLYLVDSGGAFLPLQAEVFPDRDHFGRIFYNQARMSAAGLAQVSIVLGSCTAGGAYVPAMSDETVIVKGRGTIFLGGPPLVKAATGEEVSAEELGGADVHTRTSGVADHFAADEEEALARARDVVGTLTTRKETPAASPSSRRSTARPWSAASPASWATRSASWATTGSSSRRAPSRPRTSSPCAASAGSPSSSSRTSPVSSWARSTSRRGSRRTGPRWSTPWPTPRSRSSP
jgi:acetyl-CoA carboxylase carboxyltransferase component